MLPRAPGKYVLSHSRSFISPTMATAVFYVDISRHFRVIIGYYVRITAIDIAAIMLTLPSCV